MVPEQLEETRAKSFPKLMKDNVLQNQEAQRTPNRIKIKFFENTYEYHKLLETKNHEKTF